MKWKFNVGIFLDARFYRAGVVSNERIVYINRATSRSQILSTESGHRKHGAQREWDAFRTVEPLRDAFVPQIVSKAYGISCLPSSHPHPVTKPPRVKLASGWQKRVEQMKGDMKSQANLMSKRGLKHKEVIRLAACKSLAVCDVP